MVLVVTDKGCEVDWRMLGSEGRSQFNWMPFIRTLEHVPSVSDSPTDDWSALGRRFAIEMHL